MSLPNRDQQTPAQFIAVQAKSNTLKIVLICIALAMGIVILTGIYMVFDGNNKTNEAIREFRTEYKEYVKQDKVEAERHRETMERATSALNNAARTDARIIEREKQLITITQNNEKAIRILRSLPADSQFMFFSDWVSKVTVNP